jgi:hypothetical protein
MREHRLFYRLIYEIDDKKYVPKCITMKNQKRTCGHEEHQTVETRAKNKYAQHNS